jgi:hypothetical protein
MAGSLDWSICLSFRKLFLWTGKLYKKEQSGFTLILSASVRIFRGMQQVLKSQNN